MEKHTKLNTHFKGYLVGKGYVRATKALNLMKNQFSGRVRKDGVTPVYAHSLEIAAQLRTYTFPPQVSEEDVLIVALLHDILEDTDYMSVDIQSTYGANILDAVRLLTKASDYDNRIYYANILMNILAVIVKCMDRIHNLSTMVGAFSIEKIEKYITETNEHVLPMISEAKDVYPELEAFLENMKFSILNLITFAGAVVASSKPA